MQKILILISTLFLFASCAEKYDIAGNSSVACLDGRMLYLRVTPDGTQISSIDSCQVVHGQFSFNGDVDSIVMAQLYLEGESVMPVVLENGKVSIRVDNVSQRAEGSPLNDRLYKFIQQRQRLEGQMWELEQQCLHLMREGKSPLEIRARIEPKSAKLNKKMEELEVQFIRRNYDNVLGPGLFMLLCNQYPIPVMTEQLREILHEAPAGFRQHPFVRNYIRQTGYSDLP